MNWLLDGSPLASVFTIQPSLPDASVVSALGLFGDVAEQEEALPANPAEWLASLGTPAGDGEEG